MKKYLRTLSDWQKILLATGLGALTGLILGENAGHIAFLGDIWLNMMKMLLVPLVLSMLVRGISQADDPAALGQIGVKIILFYFVTTICAGLLGSGAGFLLKPENSILAGTGETTGEGIASIPSLVDTVKGMFSSNIFKSFSDGNMMQVMVISVLLGVAIVCMPKERSRSVKNWFTGFNNLMISALAFILKLAPIGVFALMASALGTHGPLETLLLLKLLALFYFVCCVHIIFVYCLPVLLFSGLSPLSFLRKAFPVIITCLSTCSSSAVIPVSLDVAKSTFGCREEISAMSIPLGATINKDGNAILCALVAVFTARATGIPITPDFLLNVVLVSTLVTSANSGIPGGGIMNLMIVASTMGLPLEIIALIGGLYRFFDMATTTTNCLGDLSTTVVIDRTQKRVSRS